MYHIYTTRFHLDAPVTDIEDAQAYLSEDDMTQYVDVKADDGSELSDVIESVEWELTSEESGDIDVTATRELSQSELDRMSEWIGGQNSDGLGESFEQQPFANYEEESDYDDYDDYDDGAYVMASFDWRTNDYKLTKA